MMKFKALILLSFCGLLSACGGGRCVDSLPLREYGLNSIEKESNLKESTYEQCYYSCY